MHSSVLSRYSGFTLIELMITIAVAAILLAIGIPSFQSAINGSRLNNAANELLNDLMTARSHAISKGIRIVVCPSTTQVGCTVSSWGDGWILFEDNNRNGAVDAGEVILRARQALPGNLSVTAAGGAAAPIQFLPSGEVAGVAGTVGFCLPTGQPPENLRQVVIAAPSGRMRVQAINNAGVCP